MLRRACRALAFLCQERVAFTHRAFPEWGDRTHVGSDVSILWSVSASVCLLAYIAGKQSRGLSVYVAAQRQRTDYL